MMLRKRNIVLISAITAVPITVAITFSDTLNQSWWLIDIAYFPAIILSILFSGMSRSPSAAAQWSACIAYTSVYLVVAVAVYAVIWEIYLLKQVFSKLPRDHALRTDGAAFTAEGRPGNPDAFFRALGKAIIDVESRRRKRWTLADSTLALNQEPDFLGRQAILSHNPPTPAKELIKEYRGRLSKRFGEATTDRMFEELRRAARAH